MSVGGDSAATAPRYIVVGGLPAPIGGVTSFLRRLLLAEHDRIERFVDLYPGEKDPLPAAIARKVVRVHGPRGLLKLLLRAWTDPRPATWLFNFSTERALLLLALAPKPRAARWELVLHHGRLSPSRGWRGRLERRALARMACLHALSPDQADAYRDGWRTAAPVRLTTSYVPADAGEPDAAAVQRLATLRASWRRLFVASGQPTPLYNFDALAALFAEPARRQDALLMFVYGTGGELERLRAFATSQPNLVLFENCREAYFLTMLRGADAYLRATDADSFGIAVADALSAGVPALCTNVTRRFPGATLFAPGDWAALGRLIDAIPVLRPQPRPVTPPEGLAFTLGNQA